MLAAKFFDDQYFNNAYYAKVGGVPCNEINSLEVEFLFMTNFSLFVGTDTYRQYYTELCNHAQNGSCDCTSQCGRSEDPPPTHLSIRPNPTRTCLNFPVNIFPCPSQSQRSASRYQTRKGR